MSINFNRILSFPFVLLVKIYQLILSPILPNSCRHTPTCSQYAIEAMQEWGPVKGIWLGLKRLSKCHPWGTHGYDPVPRRNENSNNPVS